MNTYEQGLFYCILPKKELELEFSMPKDVLQGGGKLTMITLSYAKLKRSQENEQCIDKLIDNEPIIKYQTKFKGLKCGNLFLNHFFEDQKYMKMLISVIHSSIISKSKFKKLKIIPN
ncbi:hypothetical protein [Xanthocytophaga flava]|uniref:hypothetical protein n=1 Tax=Xanthocytophaga flava TaxID=3048013 RepID=UPI0028D07C93|nr:hypothetical protein [Xanthocytophaga flavus]MDJ1471005.1 hypothetical protein [Xanthocytophaga flavus]